MNRREFVKALAGIPLLGLLVKLPKHQENYIDYTGRDLEFSDCVGVVAEDGKTILVNGDALSKHAGLLNGKTIFVDLVAGDDANDGLTPETAVAWDGWIPLVESRECEMVITFVDKSPLVAYCDSGYANFHEYDWSKGRTIFVDKDIEMVVWGCPEESV